MIFVAVLGGLLWWRTGDVQTALTAWLTGTALTSIYWVIPIVRRPIHVGWMYAAFPIGWTVSHLLIALVYYLVLTPIGLLMRAAGYDPLQRRFDRTAATYWFAILRMATCGAISDSSNGGQETTMPQEPQQDTGDKRSAFAHAAAQRRPGVFAELWDFLKSNRKWWLTPIILVLLLFGVLLALSGTAVAPFIYTLF